MKLAKMGGLPEIFYTIQGEGASMGRPAIFVRLSLCNLKCSWCDTPYTWDWANYNKDDELLTIEVKELAELIRQYDCKRVVITGGEPLIQQAKILSLLTELGEGYIFEIETNGTIMPRSELLERIDQFNISPKLEGSGNDLFARRKDKVLQALSSGQFKFVITNEQDLDEAMDIITQNGILPSHVWLMPEGRTEAEVIEHSAWLIEKCKELGYNFTTRLHILVYSTERGR